MDFDKEYAERQIIKEKLVDFCQKHQISPEHLITLSVTVMMFQLKHHGKNLKYFTDMLEGFAKVAAKHWASLEVDG